MNGILSYDEYLRATANGLTIPHVVSLKSKSSRQQLLFYGANHVNDPSHPQCKDIERRWLDFIAAATRPIALVEGHFDKASVAETQGPIESIQKGGEAQFTVYLARRHHVDVASPEPDKLWEANKLAGEFGREATVLYYFLRQIDAWNRYSQFERDIRKAGQEVLDRTKRLLDWDDVDFSVAGMEAAYARVLGGPMSWDRLSRVVDPTSTEFMTNRIAHMSGDLRDEYILKQIKRYWQAGKSPFIVFGAAHAVRLELALKELEA